VKDKRSVGDEVLADLDVAMKAGTLASVAPAARTLSPPTKLGREMLEGAGQTIARQKDAIARLEAERGAGLVLLRLDPKTIALTEFKNRHELGLSASDPSFKALKDSIAAHGQDTPVRVRPAPPGSPAAYELVEGHRRHAACLALDAESDGGFLILARLDAAAKDTKNLVLKMYRENAERQDLSPYEYGRMFHSWLEAKVFRRQGELAVAIGLSDGSVSNYLQVADLPAEVLAAFGDPRTIAVRWTADLARALKRSAAAVKAAAREIAERNPKPGPEAVFRELTAFGKEPAQRAVSSREEAVKIKGKVAFSLTRRAGRITVKFGKTVDRSFQQEVGDAIKEAAERLLSKRLGNK
jgi:ParB family chromosome partitioning protein